MQSFTSRLLDLGMQIPDAWELRTWPDDGLEKLSRMAAACSSEGDFQSCGQGIQPLLTATLYATGINIDASIEFQAWAAEDERFLASNNGRPLKQWNVNGIETLYFDDVRERSPESVHYRFAMWKIAAGLWLYARILSVSRARFEYALSVFATLAPGGTAPRSKRRPLYEREPWIAVPTIFRMRKALTEEGPLHDLVLAGPQSPAVLDCNRQVLSWQVGRGKWTPIELRRKSRIRVQDGYYGPQELLTSGIYSSRAVQRLLPYAKAHFTPLPCSVNGKPHYILCPRRLRSVLDVERSGISRFSDGRIMRIQRYRFLRERIGDPLIFGIAEDRNSVFTTQSIPSLATAEGWTGIAFEPINGAGRDMTFPDECLVRQ